MDGRALLVVNPNATTTTPRVRDVLLTALANERDVTIVTTEARGHATEVAQKAAADGLEAVIALGGDGTINEIVNGLLADAPTGPGDRPGARVPALGIVPGGSTNVLARALGLPRDPVEATGAVLDAMRAGRTRAIGLGRVDERWFTFSAGLGLDAEVVAEVERRRDRGTPSTAGLWVRTAVRTALFSTDRRSAAMTVHPYETGQPGDTEEPGEPGEGAPVEGVHLLIVSNTVPWTYLGERPIMPNPTASFDHGLDALAVTSMRLDRVVRVAGELLLRRDGPRGRHEVRLTDSPGFRVSATRPVECQVDGDAIGTRTEVRFVSVPHALRVLVPAEDASVQVPAL